MSMPTGITTTYLVDPIAFNFYPIMRTNNYLSYYLNDWLYPSTQLIVKLKIA